VSFLALLDQVGSLQRATVTQTDAGDSSTAWAAVASGIQCAVQMKSGTRRAEDGGFVRTERWLAFLLPDQDARVGDRLVVGSDTFLVDSVDTIRGHHQEAWLRLVVGA